MVREQSDEQSDDEHHDQSVSEDEYQIGNDTDPGESELQSATNTNNPEADFCVQTAPVGDDSEIEFWESYEELKEETFEMEPLRESLDNTDNSDCVLTAEYKIEVDNEEIQ